MNVIILLPWFHQLSAQEEKGEIIVSSEKVGEVIDLEERNKYKLFQGVKGFKEAVCMKLPDNTYQLKITYLDRTSGQEKFKTWMYGDRQEIDRIRQRIEHIEKKKLIALQKQKELGARRPQDLKDSILAQNRPVNSIRGNVLGDGSLLSVNYERLFPFNERFFLTAKLGLGFTVEDKSIPGTISLDSYITIPHHITANLGKGKHFFELG